MLQNTDYTYSFTGFKTESLAPAKNVEKHEQRAHLFLNSVLM